LSFDGVVVAIDLRYTKLDGQGSRILIPNSKLFTDPITLLPQSKTRVPSGKREACRKQKIVSSRNPKLTYTALAYGREDGVVAELGARFHSFVCTENSTRNFGKSNYLGGLLARRTSTPEKRQSVYQFVLNSPMSCILGS
jgi:hypothetical protein